MFSFSDILQSVQTARTASNFDVAVGFILLLSWEVLCYFRIRAGDKTISVDIVLFLAVESILQARQGIGGPASARIRTLLTQGISFSLLILATKYKSSPGSNDANEVHEQGEGGVRTEPEEQEKTKKPSFLKPLIFPCRTVHTRYFPQKHSFSYTYFFVGVPVDFEGDAAGMLSAGNHKGRRSWFHVDPADYLQREDEHKSTLREKLDYYLQTQGIEPSTYAEAYLVTAPRFLGYGFNPVSFWYLYDDSGNLGAMILEVNNTFDERRMYFLQASQSSVTTAHTTDRESTDTTDNKGEEPTDSSKNDTSHANFETAWAKDFHVSPFNDRQGAYSLRATNIFARGKPGRVSNRIELRTPDGNLKLRASVFSTGREVDPLVLGVGARAGLLARWGGIGFLTFPRILREAWTLYMRRGLRVWFRPEVTRASIARQPTQDERVLEGYIREYLGDLVRESESDVKLIYSAPSGMTSKDEYTFTGKNFDHSVENSLTSKTLRIQVVSPSFYSRFIHYAHTREAFDREYLCTHDKNKTVYVSAPATLDRLLLAQTQQLQQQQQQQQQPWRRRPRATAEDHTENQDQTEHESKADRENEGEDEREQKQQQQRRWDRLHTGKNPGMASGSLLERARWGVVQALRSHPAEQSYLEGGNSLMGEHGSSSDNNCEDNRNSSSDRVEGEGVQVIHGDEEGCGAAVVDLKGGGAARSAPADANSNAAARCRSMNGVNSSLNRSVNIISSKKDIRACKASPLDEYVRRRSRAPATYRRTVTKMFVAARVGGSLPGMPAAVAAADALLRLFLIVAGCLMIHTANNNDNISSSSSSSIMNSINSLCKMIINMDINNSTTGNQQQKQLSAEPGWGIAQALLVGAAVTNAVHLWSMLIKGL